MYIFIVTKIIAKITVSIFDFFTNAFLYIDPFHLSFNLFSYSIYIYFKGLNNNLCIVYFNDVYS